MTICIAGIAEGKKIVAFTDRMLTLGAPVRTAFEISENDKAIQLGGNKAVALFAGDVLKANQILSIAKAKIQNNDMRVETVAGTVLEAYKDQWLSDITTGLLERFGLNRKQFIEKQNDLHPDLIKDMNNVIGQYNLDVQVIVAGVDNDGAHIFKIESPGIIQPFGSIGYCCIGSGAQHATFSLIESEYNPNLKEAESIHAILQAKRRAQYDPGVGILTDVVLINSTYVKLSEGKVKNINTLYDDSVIKIRKEKNECASLIGEKIYDAN